MEEEAMLIEMLDALNCQERNENRKHQIKVFATQSKLESISQNVFIVNYGLIKLILNIVKFYNKPVEVKIKARYITFLI